MGCSGWATCIHYQITLSAGCPSRSRKHDTASVLLLPLLLGGVAPNASPRQDLSHFPSLSVMLRNARQWLPRYLPFGTSFSQHQRPKGSEKGVLKRGTRLHTLPRVREMPESQPSQVCPPRVARSERDNGRDEPAVWHQERVLTGFCAFWKPAGPRWVPGVCLRRRTNPAVLPPGADAWYAWCRNDWPRRDGSGGRLRGQMTCVVDGSTNYRSGFNVLQVNRLSRLILG